MVSAYAVRLVGVPQGSFTLQVWTTADPEKGVQSVAAAGARIEVPATPDGRGDPKSDDDRILLVRP